MGIMRRFIDKVSGNDGIVSGRRKVFSDLLHDVTIIKSTWSLETWSSQVITLTEQLCTDTIDYLDGKYSENMWRTHHLGSVLKTIEIITQKERLELIEAEVAKVWTQAHTIKYPEGLLLLRLKELIERIKIIILYQGIVKKETRKAA